MIALQYFRKKSGLTQEQFAHKIGVSRSTLAMWETGATEPDIETVKKICRTLNVSEKNLLIKVAVWRPDYEEDYRNARDDEERLAIFEHAGVPQDMIPTYIDIRDKNDPDVPVAPTVTEDQIKVALFGGDGEVTDAMWEEVKRFAAFVKENENKKRNG